MTAQMGGPIYDLGWPFYDFLRTTCADLMGHYACIYITFEDGDEESRPPVHLRPHVGYHRVRLYLGMNPR